MRILVLEDDKKAARLPAKGLQEGELERDTMPNRLDVHVSHLRRKINVPGAGLSRRGA
jgi:DNA-binding response OmpR family regulator